MTLNGTVKKVSAALVLLGLLTGAGAAVDRRFAKAADVERALKDVHQGLMDLHLGQLQARRETLRRESFDYQNRDGRLTGLERQRMQTIREELDALDRRIETLQRAQDAR